MHAYQCFWLLVVATHRVFVPQREYIARDFHQALRATLRPHPYQPCLHEAPALDCIKAVVML